MKTCLIAASLLLLAGPSGAEQWQGTVVGVAEGDTITVLRDRTPIKIRLYGVDAPDTRQAFGQEARQFTSRRVLGKKIRVTVKAEDRDNRAVGVVTWFDARGTDRPGVARTTLHLRVLNEELVRAGLAWWTRQSAPKDKKLARLEAEAKKARRGLWADKKPVAPWIWRDGIRKPNECSSTADCVVIECCCDWHVMRQGGSAPPRCQALCDCGTIAPRPRAACLEGRCLPVTAEEARHQGNIRSRPPTLPWSKDRVCKRDKDCALLPSWCPNFCPPCIPTWRPVANQKAVKRFKIRRSKSGPCPVADCLPCAKQSNWLGTKAICIKGQCVVRP